MSEPSPQPPLPPQGAESPLNRFPEGAQQQAVPTAPATSGAAAQNFADGEWHRMHPLTPLFKGGFVLIVVAGIVISNMRERFIGWFVALFTRDEDLYGYSDGDPIDWLFENNFIFFALLGILVLVVLFIAGFWLVWRFQQFRITGDHVEVRQGIVFRSHRRAPLDRVQGVNLTRPFPARLIGLAKLEVVGAGTDANVPLEYLATARAESVRADILRLASGARANRLAAASGTPIAPGTPRAALVSSVNVGVSGLIEGVDLSDVAPESVVKIPTGRLIGSQVITGALWLVFFGIIFTIAMIGTVTSAIADGETEIGLIVLGAGLGLGIPLLIAVFGITWAMISKSLRYSIAPTPDGVRITYGLLTTVTETLPPGRIFAVEVSQSLLWRPFGWWTIKINRMSGKSASQQQSGTAQQFTVVLPVGKRVDVERVLALILPDAPTAVLPLVWQHGIDGPSEGDPYRTIPRRARWRRPLSWKRHGYVLTDFGLLLRRGIVWRKLAVFPLARVQGFSLSQGPIDRVQRVSGAQVHTVPGPVSGTLSGLEREDAVALLDELSRAAAAAASRDHTHRWGESQTLAEADWEQHGAAPAPHAVPPAPPAPHSPPAAHAGSPAPPAAHAAPPAPPAVPAPPPPATPTTESGA